jgi:beta-glucosidase
LDGIICTDAGAYRMLVTDHKYYRSPEEAAAGSIKAGINQFLDRYLDGVNGALRKNLLTEREIDDALRGIFRVLAKLGLLDPPELVPYSRIGGTADPWASERHKGLARLATQKSIVLLKNSNHLLPLNPDSLNSLAVIGPRANSVSLDWYSGTPPYIVTPLEGIKTRLGRRVSVSYSAGGDEAVKLARSADAVIVCAGNHPTGGEGAGWGKVSVPGEGREAVDRQSIVLEQEELIKQVHQVNPRTVVVLISSFPYAINWTEQNVPAILHMTHNSQETGSGLADVLFGDYNPAGRLVQTWPRSIDQLPPMMDYDIRNGRTYMYFKGEPLYPFGYGLSYTTFRYSKLRVSSRSLRPDGAVTVSLDVTNSGRRAGDEVVQLYVSHLNSRVGRPKKELKGFKRIGVHPGQTKTVSLILKGEQLAYWESSQKRFTVEPGRIRVSVGGSSADEQLSQTLQVGR